jgi:hypothetical protein
MVLTTVFILGMVGMLALAVDLGYLFSARTQFQNGIDAAALAAGSGLRVTIEEPGPGGPPQQKIIVQSMAIQFASKNQVRRFSDPPPCPDCANTPDNRNNIVIKEGNVSIDTSTDIPKVHVSASIPTPMLFASAFGVSNINMGASATASLLPVDGGTGTISEGGSLSTGCWQPLFLPDTFYNSSNMPVIVGDNSAGFPRVPNQAGDYYRSRFAAGARNIFPFVDGVIGAGASVTGLRDTQIQAEVGQQTIMGQVPYVAFKRDYYYIADFSKLPRATFDPLSAGQTARFGYCGKIRVGDDIPVFNLRDDTTYDQVRNGLLALLSQTVAGDSIDPITELQYHYVVSASYQTPNSHGGIIPVLFYNPIIWKDDSVPPSITTLKVTNFGLFFLKEVTPDGELHGYFVREVISGGTPIDSTNLGPECANSSFNCGFKRSWLPMAVQLLK